MARQTLGVLGGMGPRSTAPFLEMLLDEVQASWAPQSDFDYPPIMLFSLPAPMFLGQPLDHEAVFAAILDGCLRLQKTGIDLLAMPCNTAHRYHPELQAGLDVPLLNMVDLVVNAMPEKSQKITLLGTRWTVDSGIYQDALASRGQQWVSPEPWQAAIDQAIDATKTGGDLTPGREAWQALLAEIAQAGVDGAILACTDLNPLHQRDPQDLLVFDATASLAAEAIRRLDPPSHLQ